MKNKRWKRLSKRIIGECHKNYLCRNCKYFLLCWSVFTYKENPYSMRIKDVENKLKGDN